MMVLYINHNNNKVILNSFRPFSKISPFSFFIPFSFLNKGGYKFIDLIPLLNSLRAAGGNLTSHINITLTIIRITAVSYHIITGNHPPSYLDHKHHSWHH